MPDDIHSIGHILDEAMGTEVDTKSPLFDLDGEIAESVLTICRVASMNADALDRLPHEVFLAKKESVALRAALHPFLVLRQTLSRIPEAELDKNIDACRESVMKNLKDLMTAITGTDDSDSFSEI